MKWYSLNAIVRNVLLRRGYPLHYYMQFLVNAKDCLREMSLDSLGVINTELLDVVVDGGYNVVNLPCGYIDYVKVGVRVGQYVKPLLERDSINRLHNYDDSGDITAYSGVTDVATTESNVSLTSSSVFLQDTVTWDSYGEYIGRQYGFSGAGSESDTFKVLPERNQIQLNENISVDKIVLEYIGDGMCSDSATQVDVYAVATIEAYIISQMKEQNRNYSLTERKVAHDEYIRQYQIFLARKNPLTIEKLRRLILKNYRGSART